MGLATLIWVVAMVAIWRLNQDDDYLLVDMNREAITLEWLVATLIFVGFLLYRNI